MAETLLKTPALFLSILRSLIPTVVLFAVLILSCAGVFSMITDTTVHDSVYWSVVTGFTVGYGDVLPGDSNAAQNLTMFLIINGGVFWALVAGHITATIIGYRETEQMCELQAIINHFGITVDYKSDGR